MSTRPFPALGLVSPWKVALVLAFGVTMALGAARLAGAAALDACTVLPQKAVAKIVGNDAPIVRRVAPVERDGVTSSSCVFQQTLGAGNTGFITVSTFESNAAAQAHLTSYIERITTAGGAVEADTVAGVPATFVTATGASGQMFVIQDKILLGAGVTTRRKGMTTSVPDRTRDLVIAVLGRFRQAA